LRSNKTHTETHTVSGSIASRERAGYPLSNSSKWTQANSTQLCVHHRPLHFPIIIAIFSQHRSHITLSYSVIVAWRLTPINNHSSKRPSNLMMQHYCTFCSVFMFQTYLGDIIMGSFIPKIHGQLRPMDGKRVCFQHLPLTWVDPIGSLLSRANISKGIAGFKDGESELYLETDEPCAHSRSPCKHWVSTKTCLEDVTHCLVVY
jgi:hypothetical protein